MVICFTDASYCPMTKIGVVVCRIYNNSLTNYVDNEIYHNGVRSDDLERIGIEYCIEECNKVINEYSVIYTDYMSAVGNYNANLVYVKGHFKKSNLNDIGLIFRSVDKRARMILREIRKRTVRQS